VRYLVLAIVLAGASIAAASCDSGDAQSDATAGPGVGGAVGGGSTDGGSAPSTPSSGGGPATSSGPGGAGGGGAGGEGGAIVCPPVGPLDCSPGTGTGEADQCFDGVSCFLDNVQAAVTGVISAQPSWFDYNNPDNCPFILQIDSFMDAVAADLVAQGLCAIRDPNAPGEEVTVKHDNAYSENFDIVAANGCARYGDLIYTSYCAPAWW
jgi:hypothetical protein